MLIDNFTTHPYAVCTLNEKFVFETAVHVAILSFQFELYHVVAPLSFLRSISLAFLFAILSIRVPS